MGEFFIFGLALLGVYSIASDNKILRMLASIIITIFVLIVASFIFSGTLKSGGPKVDLTRDFNPRTNTYRR